MKVIAQTTATLEPYFPSTPLVARCGHCAEFLASEHLPSVGVCALHAVQVLEQDKACSHYYQETEAFQAEGNDDEF